LAREGRTTGVARVLKAETVASCAGQNHTEEASQAPRSVGAKRSQRTGGGAPSHGSGSEAAELSELSETSEAAESSSVGGVRREQLAGKTLWRRRGGSIRVQRETGGRSNATQTWPRAGRGRLYKPSSPVEARLRGRRSPTIRDHQTIIASSHGRPRQVRLREERAGRGFGRRPLGDRRRPRGRILVRPRSPPRHLRPSRAPRRAPVFVAVELRRRPATSPASCSWTKAARRTASGARMPATSPGAFPRSPEAS